MSPTNNRVFSNNSPYSKWKTNYCSGDFARLRFKSFHSFPADDMVSFGNFLLLTYKSKPFLGTGHRIFSGPSISVSVGGHVALQGR